MSKNVDLTSKEWCDLVFEGKNKAFGGYLLRVNSPKRYTWATVGVICVVAFAFVLPYIVESFKFGEVEEETTVVVEMTQLPEAEVEKQEVQPLVETPPPPPLKSSIKFTAPVIKKDEEVSDEEELKSQDELTQSKVNISIADVKGNDEEHGQDIADFREVIAEPVVEEEKPYEAVEQMPTFPGGETELMKFIRDNLKYPVIAQENGIQGRVILRFVVSKTGTIDNVTVLRSLDPTCDKEAIRVVKSMPKWIPGKQNGNNVPVYFTLPVVFSAGQAAQDSVELMNMYLLKADTMFQVVVERSPTDYRGYLWRSRAAAVRDPELKEGLAKPLYEETLTVLDQDPSNKEKAATKRVYIEAYKYLGYYNYLQTTNPAKKNEAIAATKDYWNKMLELDPGNTEILEALKTLDSL